MQHQIAVFRFDLDIFGFDPRQIRFEEECVFGFVEIDGWIPAADVAAKAPGPVDHLIEKPFHFARQVHRKRDQVSWFLRHRYHLLRFVRSQFIELREPFTM